MATGDLLDFKSRIKALIPRWFGDVSTILDAVITGQAYAKAYVYSLIVYAALQTRIKTATDGWLDMIAADFFGASLVRSANQSDASFRSRIIINLFRERATRNGVIKVLQDLTGQTPFIFEPSRPNDTGGYGVACGYFAAGGYGSIMLPYQAFVTAYRPLGTGIPSVSGYGVSTGGYGQSSQAEYAALSMVKNSVSDADIYAAIDSVKPAATILWTQIVSKNAAQHFYLGVNFRLGISTLG